MTEPKRGPGRPRITPEQRRLSADKSFTDSLEPQPNGCVVSKLKLIRGYDGQPLRPRRFSWVFHTKSDAVEGNVVSLCRTAGCVSRYHISQYGKLPKLEAEMSVALWNHHYAWLTYNLKRLGVDATYNNHCREEMIKQLKELCRRRPIEWEDEERWAERLKLVEEHDDAPRPLTDARVANIGPSWGLRFPVLPD